MAKGSKTKTAKKRVKVGKLSTTKTKLTGQEMKKVKGGRTETVDNNETITIHRAQKLPS